MITYVPREDLKAKWPRFAGPLSRLPSDRAEVVAFFGDPRLLDADGKPVGRPSPRWVAKHIVERQGKDAIPGIPPRFYFQCHRLAEPYIREALRRARVVCPGYRVEKAASFVYRHIRHDRKRPLSLHSFGIAIDINSDDNEGIEYRDGARPPAFFGDEWRRTWPRGMPPEFVEAFLSVGFTWGGDWDGDGRTDDHTYCDPMHFELTAPGR